MDKCVVCKDSFISSLPILTPFISFYYLIAPAKTASMMVSRSRDKGHPYLFSFFGGNHPVSHNQA